MIEIKDSLCRAFCGDLEVRNVPSGLAVRTGFNAADGDAIGFYIVRDPNDSGLYRIEDSGLLVPSLEAAGVSIDTGMRGEAFGRLLDEYGAEYDSDTCELHSEYVAESEIASEAMRFIALLLRVRDLELLTTENVENTFREDATKALTEYFAGKASLKFSTTISDALQDYVVDALIAAPGKSPVALFLGTSESRVDEAVMVWMESQMANTDVKVALLLEQERSPKITNRAYRRATNRLDATAIFRNDELASMERIGRIAGVDSRMAS